MRARKRRETACTKPLGVLFVYFGNRVFFGISGKPEICPVDHGLKLAAILLLLPSVLELQACVTIPSQ